MSNAVKTPLAQFIGVDHQYVCTEANATDMTGWSLSFMIKSRASDADGSALVTLTTGGGGIGISTTTATVSVADTDTDNLPAGLYHWELKRTDSGSEAVVGYGPFSLMRGVHHT